MDLYASSLCVVSSSGATLSGVANSFKAMAFDATSIDNGKNFSLSGGYYTIPYSGNYLIITKLRLADNLSALSYGQAAGTVLQDASYFAWYQANTTTSYNRNSSLNVRLANFSSGSKIFMYGYGFTSYQLAEMNIALLSTSTGNVALPANGLSGSDASGNPIPVVLGQGLTLGSGTLSVMGCLFT